MKYKLMLIIIIGLLLINTVNASLLAEKAITKIACSQPEACKIYQWIISSEGSAKNILFSKIPPQVQEAITSSKDPIGTAYSYIYAQLPKEATKAINIINKFESYLKDFQKIDPSSKTAQAIGDNIEYNEKEKLLILKNKDNSIFASISLDAYEIDTKAKPEDGFSLKVIDQDKARQRPLEIAGFSIKNIPKDKTIKLKEEQGITKLFLDEGDISYKDKRAVTTILNNIKNAEIRIKDKEIEYAKFTSIKPQQSYTFNYKGNIYTFQNTYANNGLIEFDPNNKKITAINAKITKNNQLINSEFSDVNILLNDKGEFSKILFSNCKNICSYTIEDIKVNSKNNFNLYIDKNIETQDIIALSINTITQKIENKDIKLKEIISRGELTYSYGNDIKIEAYKDSETFFITDLEKSIPTLNINKGSVRFFNGKYGGIIKAVNGKTKIVRVDPEFLLEQKETSPLFIGEDAITINGVLGVKNIDSYGNLEIKDMFSQSNTIDPEMFKNLKANSYIKAQLDSVRNLRDYYNTKSARIDCGLAFGIACPIKVINQQIKELEKIYPDLYKGEPLDKIIKNTEIDKTTKSVLYEYSKGEEPSWDNVAKRYMDQGSGYEQYAVAAREQFYNNLAEQTGLNKGLTAKIHRGFETKPGLYKPSQLKSRDPLLDIPPLSITSSKDLIDLKNHLCLYQKKCMSIKDYILSDGTKLSLDDLNKEIENVNNLENKYPELFKQLAKYNEIQEQQYWKYLPKAFIKEATTFVTTSIISTPISKFILKGGQAIKPIFKNPTRYAESYTVTNKIDDIVIKDINYEAKIKALEKYFAKEGKQVNRFYMLKIKSIGGGKFDIGGKEVTREATKEGGFIYESERDLWVGVGTTALPLKTIKGETAEGLAEIQTKLLQGGIKDARYYFGNIGQLTRKAYYIKIERRDGVLNKYLLDGNNLRKVTKENEHLIGPKNLKEIQIGKPSK